MPIFTHIFVARAPLINQQTKLLLLLGRKEMKSLPPIDGTDFTYRIRFREMSLFSVFHTYTQPPVKVVNLQFALPWHDGVTRPKSLFKNMLTVCLKLVPLGKFLAFALSIIIFRV